MSAIVVPAGSTVPKDPTDIKLYQFDWDTDNLAVGATITTSTFTVTAIRPSTTDAALTVDQTSILSGNRKTQLRLTAGTVGQLYEIANKIVTNESPAQTKERFFRILVQNR